MSSKKQIAIIGAGASGMVAVKACLEQGLEPVVFEKTNYTGGLWRYQEKLDEDGIASVMRSTIINSSKEMSAFSDFPPPPEYPNYMHNTKMVKYFDLYAERFDFIKYVTFRTEIISVEPATDHEATGRWTIRSRNLDSKKENIATYDGVMVCTGHHGKVNQPTIPGQDKFKGTVMHTHSLKHSKGFEDKNVVVVGIGNSGGDAAVELSVVAKQVYLSTRTGSWIFQRVGTNGQPFDTLLHRRLFNFFFSIFPYSFVCWFMEFYLNTVFNHDDYQLRPKHHVFSQHIMVNDALPNRILSGTVTVKGDIERLTEDGVIFKGENCVTPCDVLILATGYKVAFPFISDELLPVKANKVRLFKWQFIPNIPHAHTLAFIALAQPIGALVPIAEIQSRWFSLLMAGKLRLPSRDVMYEDIRQKEQLQKRFYASERHTIQVDWVPFMDDVAGEIGARPSLLKYFFTDFKLFLTLLFSPCAPYQYRLTGPNSWSGARKALLTIDERIEAPLATNNSRKAALEASKEGKQGLNSKLNQVMKKFNFFIFIILFFIGLITFILTIVAIIIL